MLYWIWYTTMVLAAMSVGYCLHALKTLSREDD